MNARVGFTRPLQFAFSKLASGCLRVVGRGKWQVNARVGFTRPFQFAFSKLASEYWEAGATVNITGCTMSGSPASTDSRPNKCAKGGFAAPRTESASLVQGRMHAILF